MKETIYFLKRMHVFGGAALYATLLVMVLLSFIDGAAILLLVSLITGSGMISMPAGGEFLEPAANVLQSVPLAWRFPLALGVYVLLIVVQTLVQRHTSIRNVKIQSEFIQQIELETYRGLLQANWLFFVKKRRSDLANILTMEINRVQSGISACLNLLSSFIFMFVQVGLAFWLAPPVTVLVLICGSFLAFFSRTFIRKAHTLGNQTSHIAESYLAGIHEQMNGIKDIKSNMLEFSYFGWFQSITKQMLDEHVAYTKLHSSSQLFYKITSAVLVAFFLFCSFYLFNIQPGEFLFIVFIFSRLWPRFMSLQSNMESIASLMPAFKILYDLQQESSAAKEIQLEHAQSDFQSKRAASKSITCQNVFFRYNPNERYILENINLFIPANQMTAIVGRSGTGKSTLIDLVMGLMPPEKGEVLVDGKLLSSSSETAAFRQSVSYVPQEPFLFNVTIQENLLIAAPHATNKQIWAALELASAAEFVRKLPNGIHTAIGDRGIQLSGGERQRLVLARAILRKPSVLILDEATSALDTENEENIQKALNLLKKRMTIVVIAHRLSTVRTANQVIVLDKGQVVQTGRFDQLAQEKNQLFQQLLKPQDERGINSFDKAKNQLVSMDSVK